MDQSETDGDAPVEHVHPTATPAHDPSSPTAAVPLGPVGAEPTQEVPGASPVPTQPVPVAATHPAPPFLPDGWQERSSGSGSASAGAEPAGAGGTGAPMVPVWGPVSPPSGPEASASSGRRGPGWLWVVVSAVAALIGALIGGGIVAASNNNTGSTTVKEISAGPALLNGTTNIESVIAKVLPAVVSIDAKSPAPVSNSIFGGGSSGGAQEDQGTGMIITPNGEVITNNHVISGATTITVTLFGKTTSMPATLVDTDPTNDVALLQITGASNLPTVNYGNSDNVQVGDAVVAIGNALGLQAGSPTVTQGIISAKGRTVHASSPSGSGTETLTNMFQTDAAINPGNSGGPLVDSSGKVIGMNTAVAADSSGTTQAQNIGFAIPSGKIEQLLPALRNKSISNNQASGTAYLGVSLETLTPQLRSQYNFVPTQGAVVLQVQSGSPADVAGLQQGDVITSFDGKPVTSADQLAAAVQADKPGKSVRIGIYRGQAQMTVTATLSSSSQAQQQPTG
ncbi:MAG TPA: trypsin-like peptidase domain-containing protein [Acidimicrobiales bacterium]